VQTASNRNDFSISVDDFIFPSRPGSPFGAELSGRLADATADLLSHHYVIGVSICVLNPGRRLSRSYQARRLSSGGRSIGKANQR